MIDVSGKEIPTIEIRTTGDTVERIALTGPVSATFFRGARRAFGYENRPIKELSDYFDRCNKDGVGIETNEEKMCEAVDSILPDGLKNALPYHAYVQIFSEAWGIVNDEFGEIGGDSKKAVSCPPPSPENSI